MPGAIQYRNHEGHVAPYPVDPTGAVGGIAIVGAQLVQPSTNGPLANGTVVSGIAVVPAAAGSTTCVGVALQDAGIFGVEGVQAALLPPNNEPSGASYPPILGGSGGVNGNVLTDMSGVLGNVSVANFAEIFVYYTSAVNFGQSLIVSAASGSNSALLNTGGCVTVAGSTPDARTLVGRCTNPGGVVGATASNPVLGRALIATA